MKSKVHLLCKKLLFNAEADRSSQNPASVPQCTHLTTKSVNDEQCNSEHCEEMALSNVVKSSFS